MTEMAPATTISRIQLYVLLWFNTNRELPCFSKTRGHLFLAPSSYLTSLNATWCTGWLLLHQIGKTAGRNVNSEHL